MQLKEIYNRKTKPEGSRRSIRDELKHKVTRWIINTFKCPAARHRGPDTVCYNVFPLLTTSSGAPVDDKITSMSAGPVGPLVLQDFVLLDELSHFAHERIPERVMHAKGAGAFGYFEVTDDTFSKFCRASLFRAVGKRTKVFVRFSTAAGEAGSCDTVRDIRGFAIKLYTDDGNWDLLGLNAPVFPIRDPILLPSLGHIQRRNPVTHLPDPNMLWDFVANRPETLNAVLFMFSDSGIPDGYRHMNHHAINTFKVVNHDGQPFYVKFHFRTNQGLKNLDPKVAEGLCGTDPDYSTRDLFYAIANQQYPSWTMYYQLMTFEQAPKYPWNPFDPTKVWPEADYPFYEIGKLVLDRNPINHFVEVEQSAFSPSRLVPGIEPSPDKTLQGRFFIYPNTQRYRLGANNQQLSVNSPLVTVTNNQRDGQMCLNNQGTTPNYYPSSLLGAPKVCPQAANSPYRVTGDVARYNADNEDNYGQVTLFWKFTLDEAQRERLVENLSDNLMKADEEIQVRVLAQLNLVANDLAQRVSSTLRKQKLSRMPG